MTLDRIVSVALDEWKAGVDAHDAGRVAAVFTEDAVFQGLKPYGVGRQAVVDYYESQPLGMTVTYRVLETRRPTDDVVFGYLAATFTYRDCPPVKITLGVTLVHAGDVWRIASYQASRVD